MNNLDKFALLDPQLKAIADRSSISTIENMKLTKANKDRLIDYWYFVHGKARPGIKPKQIINTPALLSACALRASDIQNLLQQHPKAVLAHPCGSGKTLAIAEFISLQWLDGIIYVAERVEQLLDMEALLRGLGVPDALIMVYSSKATPSVTQQRSNLHTYPIVLVTHARLMMDSPQAFTHHGIPLAPRHYMFVDESLPPIATMRMNRDMVVGLLAIGNATLGHRYAFPQTQIILAAMKHRLALYAQREFSFAGIKYMDTLDKFLGKPSGVAIEMREYALSLALQQILFGEFIEDSSCLHVLVPLAPHLCWYKAFAKLLVADATASLTDFFYKGFYIDAKPFNFSQLVNVYQYLTDYNTSRTQITKDHAESFIAIDLKCLASALAMLKPTLPYVVTFKDIKENVKAGLGLANVQHYGNTRGSNEFREADLVVLIGAYRLSPSVVTEIKTLYPGFDPIRHALATWIQEIYRSRARQGQPVNLIFVGDHNTSEALVAYLKRPVLPIVATPNSSRDYLRTLLEKQQTKLRSAIVSQLLATGTVDIKTLATRLADRSTAKVFKAARGLAKDNPVFKAQLILDEANGLIHWKDTLDADALGI